MKILKAFKSKRSRHPVSLFVIQNLPKQTKQITNNHEKISNVVRVSVYF